MYAWLSKNIVWSQLSQYFEHLPHSSEVWYSIHISTVAASRKPHNYLRTYLQHTVWQNVYIQRIVKIKSTAFLYLPGMDSTIIEVGAHAAYSILTVYN